MKLFFTIISIVPLAVGWLFGFLVKVGKVIVAAVVEGFEAGKNL